MDYYRCFTAFNPKTRKSSIINTFYWSESNRFSYPKITTEEQIATTAKYLAQAIKSKSYLYLLNKNLQSNIEKLCTIFQATVDNLVTKKLEPLQQESPPLEVNSTLTKETKVQPRVNVNPMNVTTS